jgi:hypothetical protein
MFTRILTDLERRRIRAHIKADGEKASPVTQLATRCRQNLPRIKEDLALIEEFMKHYESHVKKD